MSFLDAIIARKKQEVALLPAIESPRKKVPSLVQAILSTYPSLIGEIKPKSPSQGNLLDRKHVPDIVKIYDRHVQVISVLCDENFFGGGFDLLAEVHALTDKPLLAKEFIVDDRQIDHALAYGASAILLIAAILTSNELKHLTRYAIRLGLEVLIEVHNEEECDKASEAFNSLATRERIYVLIGINNRNLHTLQTDIRTTERLSPLLRKRLPGLQGIISESGIFTADDIQRLTPLVEGFLIGTAILQSDSPESTIISLFQS